jgi:putative mRNA 3-end processing factor
LAANASVTQRGAVLLGKHVACDAFDECKPLRVVSHAHADHMVGLKQSLATCEKVLMTKATKDLIDVLRGSPLLAKGFVETMEYGQTIQYEDERLTLFKANHILGASQVLVEDSEGERIVFTGDFKIDGTPVLEADVLVMEATYGSPRCIRAFETAPEDLLVSLIQKGLKDGPVNIFGYHGKLQEIMQIVHDAGVQAPMLMSERIYHVSRVCEKHGMRLGRLFLTEEKEAREMLQKNSSCMVFHHMNSRGSLADDVFSIYVSGWEFNSPCREISDKEYVVALSDHSDFDGLTEYVERSKPKLVITDNHRVGHAETFAKQVYTRFGISAVALPKSRFDSA